jgi:O-antigen ligase
MLPIGGLALVAIAFTVAAGPRKLMERFDTIEGDFNRFQVASATWRKALERPLSGYGAGTFSIVYPSFAEFDDGHAWNHAHNDTVQMALELGLGGALVPFALAGLILVRRREKEIWLGAALPLLAAWAHSWTEFPAQMPGLVLVALVLLAQIAAAEQNSPNRIRRRRRKKTSGVTP